MEARKGLEKVLGDLGQPLGSLSASTGPSPSLISNPEQKSHLSLLRAWVHSTALKIDGPHLQLSGVRVKTPAGRSCLGEESCGGEHAGVPGGALENDSGRESTPPQVSVPRGWQTFLG